MANIAVPRSTNLTESSEISGSLNVETIDDNSNNNNDVDHADVEFEQQKLEWRHEQERMAAQVVALADETVDYENDCREEQVVDTESDFQRSFAFGENQAFQFIPTSWYDENSNATALPCCSHNNAHYFGGVDVSFPKEGGDQGHKKDDGDHSPKTMAIAAYVIIDLTLQTIIYSDVEKYHVTVPYIPSYLAFREVAPLVTLIQRQQTNRPNVTPRAILVDGNGIFHERFAGLACFVGVLTQIPTIGVGKTCSSVHGITLSQVNCALEQTLQELSQEIHQNEQLRKQLQQQRGNDKYGIDGGVVFHRRKRHSTSQLHEEQQVSPTSTTATRAHDVTHTTTKLNRGPLVKYLTPTFCKGIAVPLVSPTNGRTLACALVGHAGSSEVKKCKTSNRSSLQGIEDDRHVGDEHDKLAITCGQKSGTKNPIFISVGHNISLQEAVMIATRCCIHARIPEPIRMADAMSREFLRQEQKS